jgi:protein-disulfide isomerase
VYRHYPLPMHEYAARAAQASIEAERQDRFWEYHDRLFENQQALSDADLVGHAEWLGLDGEAVAQALVAGTHQARMHADMELGRSLGVTGTPTFFLNGFRFQGVPRLWMLEIALEAFRTGLVKPQASPGGEPGDEGRAAG